MTAETPLVVRWTIGDVSDEGFEALRLSVWGLWTLLGAEPRYVVCVNSISVEDARGRAGDLPPRVEWRDVSRALWPDIRPYLSRDFAEGVAWKFAPLRIDPSAHELALDNDCIMWALPDPLREWLRAPADCLVAEDVRLGFGQFADHCGPEPRNSGIRGVPATFDIGEALLDVLRSRSVVLSSELDEQGLQVAALTRRGAASVVRVEDVSICSPFPPHIPELGRCGAHFVGLNSRSLPWAFEGRPAVEHIREHWRRRRDTVYERVGIAPYRARQT